MKYGFTGTREGLTAAQEDALRSFLLQCGMPQEWHNGACIGADEESLRLVRSLWGAEVLLYSYPSNLEGMTSDYCTDVFVHNISAPQPPLKRNHAIVDAVDLLIACPRTDEEERRSGTWVTIRYARKKGVEVVVITPDGNLIESDDNG